MTGSPEHADGPAPQAAPQAPPQAPSQARIRSAGPADAAALMRLKRHLDEETSFMLLEPGERDPSVLKLAAHLADVAGSGNSLVLLAETGGELAGYLELIGGKARRNRVTTHVVVGVLARAGGQGVGSGLLREAVRWSAEQGLHRVELTVMAHNTRAVTLYERMGFVTEGRARECLHVDGRFVDELQMAMLLSGPRAAQPGPPGGGAEAPPGSPADRADGHQG